MTETNKLNKHNNVKNPRLPEESQLAIYRRVENLNLGLPRTNPASGLGGT